MMADSPAMELLKEVLAREGGEFEMSVAEGSEFMACLADVAIEKHELFREGWPCWTRAAVGRKKEKEKECLHCLGTGWVRKS